MTESPNTQQPRGWRDVKIAPNMPLDAIVHFLNVLNERLSTIEDLIRITLPTGQEVSLTEAYMMQEAEQAQEETSNKGE